MAQPFKIEPLHYEIFPDEAAQIDKCKEWGLLSEKAAKSKVFYYKGNGLNVPCSIIGYVDRMTAVIEFGEGDKHCIHPSYLKEMQASTYSSRGSSAAEEAAESEDAAQAADESDEPVAANTGGQAPASPPEQPAAEPEELQAQSTPKEKPTKKKSAKLELPEEKVRMTATVKEFTTVPNNFSDTDDEVVIYEAVTIEEPSIEVGDAWSSHSATLKKLELAVGDVLTFEAKIIAKKLTKHPVPYKINNPAKLQKR